MIAVFCMDDHATFPDNLKNGLRDEALDCLISITPAASQTEALEKLLGLGHWYDFDVILLDVNMEAFGTQDGGVRVFKQLSDHARARGISLRGHCDVVFCTAYAEKLAGSMLAPIFEGEDFSTWPIFLDKTSEDAMRVLRYLRGKALQEERRSLASDLPLDQLLALQAAATEARTDLANGATSLSNLAEVCKRLGSDPHALWRRRMSRLGTITDPYAKETVVEGLLQNCKSILTTGVNRNTWYVTWLTAKSGRATDTTNPSFLLLTHAQTDLVKRFVRDNRRAVTAGSLEQLARCQSMTDPRVHEALGDFRAFVTSMEESGEPWNEWDANGGLGERHKVEIVGEIARAFGRSRVRWLDRSTGMATDLCEAAKECHARLLADDLRAGLSYFASWDLTGLYFHEYLRYASGEAQVASLVLGTSSHELPALETLAGHSATGHSSGRARLSRWTEIGQGTRLDEAMWRVVVGGSESSPGIECRLIEPQWNDCAWNSVLTLSWTMPLSVDAAPPPPPEVDWARIWRK